MNIIIGNVTSMTIREIWENSEFLHKLRGMKYKDLDECSSCNMREYCYRCPGVVYLENGNITSKNSLECLHALARKKVDLTNDFIR